MRSARLLLAAIAIAAPGVPAAPPLPDPTQPPIVRAATAARSAAAASAPAARPRVTSILITQRGEASAWVDGQLVRVGERLGGDTVARIDTQGVTLQGRLGAQRLWLLNETNPRPRSAPPEPHPPEPRVELAERANP
ncbi:MAG: hypothetical protein U1E89_13355 [Burkholderiaceae bacterium]